MRDATVSNIRQLLVTREALALAGLSAREVARAVDGGTLVRVRRGWYVDRRDLEQLWPSSRHLAHVVAANDSSVVPPVFALTSAAVIHGLPLYRSRADRVHTIHPDADRRTTPGIVRHRMALDTADIVEVGGLLCTCLERTVVDLLRCASAEVALSCADAALARIGGDPRAYNLAAAESWRDALRDRVSAAPGARGIREARELVELIDGRSQLPLESVTKLQLRRLGFRDLRLQVPVAAPRGGSFWLDICIDEAGVFFECDGEAKYTDEALRAGKRLEEVLLAEKQREDWVRGTTGMRVVRGGMPDAATPEALADRLQSFGIRLPDHRARPFLPRRPLLRGQ